MITPKIYIITEGQTETAYLSIIVRNLIREKSHNSIMPCE